MSMYRSLVGDLFRHEKVVTTETKAKRVRGFADQMITLGRKGTLQARRQALAFVIDEEVVDKVFGDVAARANAVANRRGGYTRIAKLGARAGDGAPLVRLDLVLD